MRKYSSDVCQLLMKKVCVMEPRIGSTTQVTSSIILYCLTIKSNSSCIHFQLSLSVCCLLYTHLSEKSNCRLKLCEYKACILYYSVLTLHSSVHVFRTIILPIGNLYVDIVSLLHSCSDNTNKCLTFWSRPLEMNNEISSVFPSLHQLSMCVQ